MGTYNDLNPTPMDMTGWQTVFFDGFNGTSLDRGKWPVTYGGGSLYWNGAFRWENEQLSVGNGALTIGMDRGSDGIWSVGGLSSAPWPGAPDGIGHGFTYGRVEIRAKTSAEVVGAGPCFLLWPTSLDTWPPEIDILETPANGQGMFTNHWQGPGGNGDDRYESKFFALDHSQWHTFTLDWLPDRLVLYVDGAKVAEITGNIPSTQMSVGLQGHVGTAWDGWYGSPNGSGVNSVDIEVDWVRVSEYVGTTPPPTDPTPTLPQPSKPAPAGIVWTGNATNETMRGAARDDLLSGGGGNDHLLGGAGADTLRGQDGNDTLVGGAGGDLLEGGAGNDVLRGNEGNDRIVTGAGVDRVIFGLGDGADVVTDFQRGTDRVQLVGVTAEQVVAKALTLEGVAGLQLRLPGGETLFLQGVGASTAQQLGLPGSFAAGSDLPVAAGGGQTITGTNGDDWLKGGAGGDVLSGGAGSDDLQGMAGNDTLRGGRGDDGLTGGAGVDLFVFARGDGSDWIVDFERGTEKLRLVGITAAEVTQRVEARWEHTGLVLDLGKGDEIYLQDVTQKLAAADMVFA